MSAISVTNAAQGDHVYECKPTVPPIRLGSNHLDQNPKPLKRPDDWRLKPAPSPIRVIRDRICKAQNSTADFADITDEDGQKSNYQVLGQSRGRMNGKDSPRLPPIRVIREIRSQICNLPSSTADSADFTDGYGWKSSCEIRHMSADRWNKMPTVSKNVPVGKDGWFSIL